MGKVEKNKKMNILVMGGAGYIGSHIVKHLGDETNHSITVIDNLSTGNRDSVLYGEFIKADLADTDLLNDIFVKKSFDAVIHLAASIVVPESVVNPLKYYTNNTVNTINLVNLCVKHNISKFIFSSTAAVYGEAKNEPVKETTPTNPINPYGWSKLMSERVIQDAGAAYKNFKYVILRYFNVAGADTKGRIGQRFPNATHLIKLTAEAAIGERSKISIYGDDFNTRDGSGIRDYIHVDDLARAHIAALDYFKNGGNEIFNCGYNQGYSVKEVVSTFKQISNFNFPIEITARRPGDPASLVADNTKITNKLNWVPKYNNLNLICQTALDWEKKIRLLLEN